MPEENPKISVIIPTYNRAKYITAAIESVLSQKGEYLLEVVVIDDGSTDETEEILKQFGSKIIYKKMENSGRPAVPRNVGIKMSKGELIAFQDSDDLWPADKLDKQVRAFDDPEIILSYGNAEILSQDGKRTGKTVISSDQARSGDVFGSLLIENFISTLTVMVRKEALIKAGGFNESPKLRGVEDYELWLRLASTGRLAYLDEVLAYYRQHDGNISHVGELGAYKRLLEVYKSLLKTPLADAQKEAVRKRLSDMYESTAHLATGFTRRYFLFQARRLRRT